MSLTKATFSMIQGAMFNVLDYGADPTGVADSAAAIQTAITAAQTAGGSVYLPTGAYKVNTTISITEPIGFFGEANLIDNIGDRGGAYLIKGADAIAIEITNSAGCTLQDFAVVGSGSDTTQGIKLTQCGRSKLERISVVECGSHGIEFNNGNLTSFRDIYVLGNGGDGLFVNGAATPDTNACVFQNIDARGNTGVGVNFANAWNVFGQGITAQQNTGAGVRLDNCRQSHIVMYGEANATNLDLQLTSNANCEGNIIYLLFYNSFTDNSSGQNIIWLSKTGADTWSSFEKMYAKSFSIPNIVFLGSLTLDHVANAQHRLFLGDTGQAQKIRIKNTGGLTDPDADAPLYPAVLKYEGGVVERTRLSFTDGDTTPDVTLSESWLANNSGATTITTFNGGQTGQTICIVANNGNTTLQHSGITSGLRLKGGVNKTLGQYEGITFIKNGTDWWVEV
jgi:hypothetical protein